METNRFTRNRRRINVAKFGSSKKRSWRLKLTPKRRRRFRVASPAKLWHKFKNAYVKMMLRLAGGGGVVLGMTRIPAARDAHVAYSRREFEIRLILEIYKSLAASLELGYNK